jgi:hypothetical protein
MSGRANSSRKIQQTQKSFSTLTGSSESRRLHSLHAAAWSAGDS